jgi:hypothetical protein
MKRRFLSFWNRFAFRRRVSTCRPSWHRLRLETLEKRTVPSILFGNTSNTIHDGGGPVLDHVHVELIFWGAGWNAHQDIQATMTSAVDSILTGPYLSGLSQYRSTLGTGTRVGALTITSSSPPGLFSNGDVVSFLQTSINRGVVPSPASDGQLLYVVVPQPGSSTSNDWGYHSANYSTQGRFHYAWTIDDGTLDTFTYNFSHELVESMTDPDGNAIQVNPSNPINWNEIADNEAQQYSYRLNNILVTSYLSVRDHAYVVPTGQSQNYRVNSGTLTVTGDQLASTADQITVDLSGSNGVLVSLNGETAQFDAGVINGITINDGTGPDVITVKQTSAQAPVTIASNGSDAITVSDDGSAQNIRGSVTITDSAGSTSLTLDDSADPAATTATLNTVNIGGSVYDQVLGLAPAAIQYGVGDTSSATIRTGAGGSTFSVLAALVPTTLTGNSSGTNNLVGPNSSTTWQINGINAGSLASASFAAPVIFSGFQNLMGGTGTDAFILADGQGVTGVISGAGSGDWLDESAYTTAVTVNLATGQATGTGRVKNIQNVIGGAASDLLIGDAAGNILMGGAGVNVLQSGSGRSLLIGGAGSATMTGGANDDVFVAGTTTFDLDRTALASILAEWQRTDKGFQGRLADLQTGTTGLNGANHLIWGTTVFDNGQANTVTGGAGQNWYFSASLSAITNPRAADQIGTPVNLLFVLGLDSQVYAQRVDARGNPAWSYFLVQPGVVDAFSAGRDGHGYLVLFVIGPNDRVYGLKFDPFGQAAGGYFLTSDLRVQAIEAGRDAANEPELFALGLDRQVYAQKFDASGNPSGGFKLTAPGQVEALQSGHDAGNRPELFVIGLDGQVWAQKLDANGNSTGAYFLTQPGVVKDLRVSSDAGNRPVIFVIGLNDQVYAQHFDAAGNSTGPYALTTVGRVKSIQVTQDLSHHPELFVIGLDSQVYSQQFDGAGHSLGGYRFTSSGAVESIAVGQDPASKPVVFATGLDDQVYHESFDASGSAVGPYTLATTGRVLQIVYIT